MTDREHDLHDPLHDPLTDDGRLEESAPLDPDAERGVDLDDDAELELPPPTLDPEERVEAEPDPDIALDGDRPAG